MTVTQVTKHYRGVISITEWLPMSQSQVTWLHDTKKNIKDSKIDDII